MVDSRAKFLQCPLCKALQSPFLHQQTPKQGAREFYRCLQCDLIFADPRYRLAPSEEISRYETHENDPNHPGYRKFLLDFFAPLQKKVPAPAQGLDFGSGPFPALATLLEKEGYQMSLYDKFFHHQPENLNRTYDFVTCTETAEHFHEPAAEFELLARLLKRGGWLGVRTQMLGASENFADWYYHRDPTHVCFYSALTMQWIARNFGWQSFFPCPHVTLFQTDVLQGNT